MMRVLYFMLRALYIHMGYTRNQKKRKKKQKNSLHHSRTVDLILFCSVEQSFFFTNKFTISPYTHALRNIAVSFTFIAWLCR